MLSHTSSSFPQLPSRLAHGMTSVPVYATSSGLLAMLHDPTPGVRKSALQMLLKIVDVLWHEVAEALPDLESFAEDDSLDTETRSCAAAVASRVYFHLEENVQALRLALMSGKQYFNFSKDSSKEDPYASALISSAVRLYIKYRKNETIAEGEFAKGEDESFLRLLDQGADEEMEGGVKGKSLVDMTELEALVDSMFHRCYADAEYNHALGVALEALHVPKVKQVLETARKQATTSEYQDVLAYAVYASVNLVSSKRFRIAVLEVLAKEYSNLDMVDTDMDWSALCKVQQLLEKPEEVADIIVSILSKSDNEDAALVGFQLCFDLVDSGDMGFFNRVAAALPSRPDEEDGASNGLKWDMLDQARRVLTGGFPGELALSFLHKQSDSDPLIMENVKKALDEKGGRNSVLHNCAVACHAYLNAGTTNDSFLRTHLDWMKKASNWAKFSATASLGVIHASHVTEAMTLLEPYLPPAPSTENPPATAGGYAEGGSLLALGLIHGSNIACDSEKRKEACDYLREHLRFSHSNEVISHGAALAVGLTAAGSQDMQIVNELKELLYTDSAVSGEAAGIALGLVLVGSGFSGSAEKISVIEELKSYAKDTQHEKIIRGISLGLALMAYGQEEQADETLEEMHGDRDPILRYGANYGTALAYCGTGSNKAIRSLLHTAVSDVDDDVRMAAVIGLAFVLYKTPERVPQLVKLLLESFNPHVRYAACIAIGIAMTGTGDSEAVSMLEPMMQDMTDYVRQGALLGTAMIYMQQSDSCNGRKIKSFREKIASMLRDKHQSTLTKMGAILGTGVLDAGGRNCSLFLGGSNGFTKMNAAIGMVLWLQHWHWYPMMHMLSLALTPTFTIGINKDFKYPKNFKINCKAKPSEFAYPKRLEEKKEEKKKRVETVALSTTAKEKARVARKKAKEESEFGASISMDVDTPKGDEQKDEGGVEVEEAKVDEAPKKKEPEPSSFTLCNPSRITRLQSLVCNFDVSQRHRPVRPDRLPLGVVMLTDSTPDEEEELLVVQNPYEEEEAEMPEAFEWAPPGHAEHEEPLPVPVYPKEEEKELS